MSRDIFISYSRRDQEFVTRLASDLHAQVTGVWFDQAAIQVGQKWHDEIIDGIHECKAFILILSPDAAESKYVREEVNKALELGKTIFPILYRPGEWTGEFESLVKEIQTLDLRSGSYTDNFYKLVDGLVEAGAVKATTERPFLRQTTQTPINSVLSKVPGWALAWGVGWIIFLLLSYIIFFVGDAVIRGGFDGELLLVITLLFLSGCAAGFAGGIIAGFFTMLALRPNAPSISWKHMAPAIRIWGVNGVLGVIISIVLALPLIFVSPLSGSMNFDTLYSIGFFLLVFTFWSFNGIFAGWQAVSHIRRLEPGITSRQSRGVSFGWGCGTIGAVLVWFVLFVILLAISMALGFM